MLLQEILRRSTADASRTNALHHLQWTLGAFLVLLVGAGSYGVAQWVLYLLATGVVVSLISYLATHFYFMVRNPDALRSEKYSIQKMAIERGLYGDSEGGMREALLPGPTVLNQVQDQSQTGRKNV
jgi:hypothetical protein